MTITNGYATLAQLRAELGSYLVADTSDDSKLETSIEAASRMIDGHCGQRFWQDPQVTARTFYAQNPRTFEILEGDGISTATGLIVKLDLDDNGTFETTLTINTDFTLYPTNAEVLVPAVPYTQIYMTGVNYWFWRSLYGRPLIQITAKWGWAAVPMDVTKACLIQAADLFKAKDAPFGVAGVSDMGVLRVKSSLNAVARALVAPYRKAAVG